MAASVNARGSRAPTQGVLHDVLIVIAGNVLCLALIALGTFVVMRTSSAGRLMIEYAAASNDPAAQVAVLDRYEDPFGTVMSLEDWLLLVSGVTAAIVGAMVGALVWHRAFWIPILSVLPLAVSPLLTLSSYPAAWFRAAAWGAIAWAAATLVGRRRRGRQARTKASPSGTL
jgi:hypothetical protein